MAGSRVNEIDLLRFVAAVAVVFYHYAFRGFAADSMSVMPYPLLASGAKYGYLGVELFFMISGFVILMTAANGSVRDFVISRAVRLYPAFWVCCTATFLVIMFIGEPRYSASLEQYIVNMTMLSGFVGVPPIDGVYWSLFVEMRFYALVAIVLLIGRIHQAQAFLVAWLIASIALELAPHRMLRALFIVSYSSYFIAGAAFFLIWAKGVTRARVAIVIGSWCLAVVQGMKGLPPLEKHYGTALNDWVVAGLITCFFVAMLLVSLRRTGSLGHVRWIMLGALTYPLYLLHQNIGFMVFNALYPAVNEHVLFWGTTSLVLILAYLVHRLVERPFALPMKRQLNALADWVQRSLPSARHR